MNKKCVALTDEQYRECIQLLRNGFMTSSQSFIRPNDRIATIAVIQSCLGLRLGDVLQLRLTSFIRDSDRWRLDIKEQKTKKMRVFTVPTNVYSFIQNYAIKNGIGMESRLFNISARQVERHLNRVFEKMELPLRNYGSHSFRKYFSNKVYVDNEYNIELVRVLLQHSSIQTTQRYLSLSAKMVEDAIEKTSNNLI